ncbi:MAG: DUF86 domain-containing protein [Oscillibacter sp.]|nr:DUF86 domain-containing protein [Oscillibacter sp.]
MNRRDEVIREKILGYCREIEEAHRHFREDKSLFCDRENGAVYRNAVSMPLLQIGELAKNLSDEFRACHSEIPWRDAMRMRDLFAHHYGAVDYEQTWDTSHSSVLELKRCLETADS